LKTKNFVGSSSNHIESEIRQLQELRNKDLLVLSACQTFVGDGFGVAGSAIFAGVKTAIGSYWNVPDSGSMVLMTGFYQQLLGNGLSKTKSLQEAQKSMILGKVKITDVAGTTDRSELSINNKVLSSEYGQKDIKAALFRSDDPSLDYLKHPYYWTAFSLIGNPW
jgi:CHAT domain-containing protein